MKVNMETELNKVKEAYAKKHNALIRWIPMFVVISVCIILGTSIKLNDKNYSIWGQIILLLLVAIAVYNTGKLSQNNYLAVKDTYFNKANTGTDKEREEWVKAYDDFAAKVKKDETVFNFNFVLSDTILVELICMVIVGAVILVGKLLKLWGLTVVGSSICYLILLAMFVVFICDSLTEILLKSTVKDIYKP